MSETRLLRSRVRELQAELKRAMAELESREELIVGLSKAVEKYPPPEIKYESPKMQKIPATAVLCLGDWHIGARVRPQDTGGNSYNFQTAKARLVTMLCRLREWLSSLRKTYTVDEIVVLGLGDMIDGLIHQELMIYAEFEPVKQVARAGYLLAATVREIAALTKTVRVEALDGDNHTRLTQKPYYSHRGLWSLGHLVNVIAGQALSNCPTVTFNQHDEAKTIVPAGSAKVLIQHGNDIRGYFGGIPFYGIIRALGREASNRLRAPSTAQFDLMVLAHFHVPMLLLPHIVVNGSLVGTTPQANIGMSMSCPPSQTALLLDGQRRIVSYAPLYV